MRIYPLDVPNPRRNVEGFNRFLRENNEILDETKHWLLHVNAYESDRLVLWHKLNVRYLFQVPHFHYDEIRHIMSEYKDKRWQINKDADKSVPHRLHLHIYLL